MAHAESIADQIAFQVNEAYRGAVTAWVGIAMCDQPWISARELPTRAIAVVAREPPRRRRSPMCKRH